jgi:hypothetical protein
MFGTNRIKMMRDVYFIEDQLSKATSKLAGELVLQAWPPYDPTQHSGPDSVL